MDKIEINNYKAFMYDKNNIHKCSGCPENKEMSNDASGNRLPCGQYNCWVAIHCK